MTALTISQEYLIEAPPFGCNGLLGLQQNQYYWIRHADGTRFIAKLESSAWWTFGYCNHAGSGDLPREGSGELSMTKRTKYPFWNFWFAYGVIPFVIGLWFFFKIWPSYP